MRAVRFNLQRGGSEHQSELERVALRVHDLCGWHVELYVANRELAGLRDPLANCRKSPSTISGSQRTVSTISYGWSNAVHT